MFGSQSNRLKRWKLIGLFAIILLNDQPIRRVNMLRGDMQVTCLSLENTYEIGRLLFDVVQKMVFFLGVCPFWIFWKSCIFRCQKKGAFVGCLAETRNIKPLTVAFAAPGDGMRGWSDCSRWSEGLTKQSCCKIFRWWYETSNFKHVLFVFKPGNVGVFMIQVDFRISFRWVESQPGFHWFWF